MAFFANRVGIWTRNPSTALDVEGDVALGKSDGSDGVYVRGVLDFRSLVASTLPTNGIAQIAANTIAIRTKDAANAISEDRLVIYDSSNIDAKQNLRVLVRFLNSSGVGLARGSMVTLDSSGALQVAIASNVAACEGTVGVVFADAPGGTYGFVQISGIAYVLSTTSLVPGSEAYLSPAVAGYVQPTPQMATGQAQFVVGPAVSEDHVLLRPQLRGAVGNIYEESVNVVSGAPGSDHEITGPVATDTEIVLPVDSRNFNQPKLYPVGSGLLQVYLNGQQLDRERDFQEVGAGPTSNRIRIKLPLVVDDEVSFRMELTSPAFFALAGGGGGSGDVTNGQNLGILADGAALFAAKSGTFLQFRRLKGGVGCTVSETGNSVVIDVVGGGGGATSLSGLSDVAVATPATGQFLRYNGTKWSNQSVTLVTALSGLSDVQLSTLSAGQVLTWNGTRWVNSAVASGGASSLGGLSDVSLSSPVNAQVLKFNGTQWVNAILNLSTLPDVSVATPTNGQVLTYNGSQWVNATPASSGSGSAGNLDSLTDVAIASPINNHVLKYNGTQWVNSALALGSLSDVNVSTPTNNQVLAWNSSTSRWVNTTMSAGATTLAGLTDVQVSTPTSSQFLRYNGTKWINQSVTIPAVLSDLSNVVITTPASGQVLTYNGTNWINQAPTGGSGSGASNLSQLGDVAVASIQDGQVLVFDSATSKWKNTADEKLFRKTYDAGRITLYAFGTAADVNAISVVKTSNVVTISSVAGTAKLVSIFAVFTNTDTISTNYDIVFPDMNGTSDIATVHMPLGLRMIGNTNPPTQWTQSATTQTTYTIPSGQITLRFSGITAGTYGSVKVVW